MNNISIPCSCSEADMAIFDHSHRHTSEIYFENKFPTMFMMLGQRNYIEFEENNLEIDNFKCHDFKR